VGGYCYYAFNRGNGRARVFHDDDDYHWQGRFKAFPIEEDDHLLTVLRYVERNPLRAGLVACADQWAWSSLPVWLEPPLLAWLDPGPVPRHSSWLEYIHALQTESGLAALKRSVERGAPFGRPEWVKRTAAQLGLESSLNPPGRPRKGAYLKGTHEDLFSPKDL
jgi:putative transposase